MLALYIIGGSLLYGVFVLFVLALCHAAKDRLPPPRYSRPSRSASTTHPHHRRTAPTSTRCWADPPA